MRKLQRLLESLEARHPIGTLILGKRGKSCELFIEEDRIYFAGREWSGNVDIEGLQASGILGTKISIGVLETAMGSANLFQKPLPEVLFGQGLIGPDERRVLMAGQVREEIFARALRHADSIGFQEEQVPDQLLGDDPLKAPVPLREIIEMIRTRTEALAAIDGLLPSRKEILVVTEKGMARQGKAEADFAESRIFSLIDGFRDLQQILRDNPFFDFFVLGRLAEALSAGHLKKTVLPEIRDVNLTGIGREEGEKLLPMFKAAVKHAVDELGAREKLALLYERAEKVDEAVIQYNFVGDALYRMKKTAKALAAFGRALELRPANALISDKVIKIHQESAEEALAAGNRAEAVKLLRTALHLRPDHEDVLGRLLDLHLDAGDLREASELCDMEIARSKARQDIGPGLRALTKVAARFPREPAFKKKRINLHIDFGMDREAVAELEELADREMKVGQAARAQEILEKIIRIDPSRDDIRRELRRMERKATGRKIPDRRIYFRHVVFLPIVAVAVYQVWAFVAMLGLRSATPVAVAEEAGAAGDPPGILPTEREDRLEEVAERAEKFAERFPLTAAIPEAERIAQAYRTEATRLARERERRKEAIYSEGMGLQAAGRNDEAARSLRKLLVLDEGDGWRTRAEEAIAAIETYESAAAALLREATDAEGSGGIAEAYWKIRKILEEFPNSDAAVSIELPLEIRTVPEGAALKVDGQPIGKSPQLIRLGPIRPPRIEAEAEGFEPVLEDLRAEGGPTRMVILSRKPAWKTALGAPARFVPVIARDTVLAVSSEGVLSARSRDDGSPRWSHSCGTIVTPIAAPISLDGRVYLALNDGQILRYSPEGAIDLRMKPRGLIAAGPVPLGGEVAFALTSGGFGFWRPAEDRVEVPFRAGGIPARIEAVDDEAILAAAEKGTVVKVDRKAGRIRWEAEVPGRMRSGPLRAGPAVVVQLAAGDICALDGRTGKSLWRHPLPPAAAVTGLSRKGSVLFTEEDRGGPTGLVELDGATGKETARVKAPEAVASLSEVGGGPGLILASGAFVLLEAGTWKPLWGWKPASGRVVFAADDGGLVVLATSDGELAAFAPR